MRIDRRTMLAGGVALAAAPAFAKPKAKADWYDRAIIIDALGGVGRPLWARGPSAPERAGLGRNGRDRRDPAARHGDAGRQRRPIRGKTYQEDVALKHNILNANPDRLLLVRTAADILKSKREKKFGVILGTQDTSMVGPELDRLAQLKKDGVMTVQLTYNNRNLAGDGALEPANAGLSKLGRATIERIEKEKLLLDLSHGGAKTMAEAAAHAKRPLVISHTGARAVTDHPRNTADETIKAVADKGGVVGVYFMPFLRTDGKARADDVIAHVEHVGQDRRRRPCRHRHRQWRAADPARCRDQGEDGSVAEAADRRWNCVAGRSDRRLSAGRGL